MVTRDCQYLEEDEEYEPVIGILSCSCKRCGKKMICLENNKWVCEGGDSWGEEANGKLYFFYTPCPYYDNVS